MKNVLLTALTFIGLSAFAPRAEAGGFFRSSERYDRHDRCDRSSSYSRSRETYYAPTYYRSYRPQTYSTYRRPTYVRDTCQTSRRSHYSAPRFSISFGF